MTISEAIKQLDDLILSSGAPVEEQHNLMNCVSKLIESGQKFCKYTIIFESKEIVIFKK